MYQTFKVPLVGLIENMSHVICTNCNEKLQIYPNSTTELAKDLGIEVLESIPIDAQLSQCADTGIPIVIKSPNSEHYKSYETIAKKLITFLEQRMGKKIL